MKKQLCILFVFSLSIPLVGQNKIITESPCTDALAQNAQGRWIKGTDLGSITQEKQSTCLIRFMTGSFMEKDFPFEKLQTMIDK